MFVHDSLTISMQAIVCNVCEKTLQIIACICNVFCTMVSACFDWMLLCHKDPHELNAQQHDITGGGGISGLTSCERGLQISLMLTQLHTMVSPNSGMDIMPFAKGTTHDLKHPSADSLYGETVCLLSHVKTLAPAHLVGLLRVGLLLKDRSALHT